MTYFASISGALRRLLVVIGCVVLATAQPMSCFAAGPGDAPPPSDAVIYPKGAPDSTAQTLSPPPAAGNTYFLVVAVLMAGLGAWVLWKRRTGDLRFGKTSGNKLAIEETRSLGNRQYLVVAAYEGRKFLLGVTMDRIELLTHLPDSGEEEEKLP